MSEWTIGRLIAAERKKQKLPGKILIEGIGTKQNLQELESDCLQSNKLLVDVLLQRLGRSPDNLEYILSWNEYRLECIRDWFEECIFKKKKKWAEKALHLYEQRAQKHGAVQRMYQYRGQAMIAYWIDGNRAAAENWLTKALDTTFPQWRKPIWENCRISTMELENALALVRVKREQGKQTGVLLEQCGIYIRKYVTDGEENAKIYSKYAWLSAKQESGIGNLGKALALCVEAFNLLQQYSIGYFTQPLLSSIIEYQEEMNKIRAGKLVWHADRVDSTAHRTEKGTNYTADEVVSAIEETREKCHYRKYLDALCHLKEQFAENWYPQDSILYDCCQKAYYLDFEILRAERCARGMTQEEIVEGVYENPKEIAKIENRRSSPRGRHFSGLMEKFGLERERMSGLVVTNSFRALELQKQIQAYFSRHEYNAAKPLLQELEKELDMDHAENRRVIRWIQNVIDISEGNCSCENILENDWKMLGETYFLSPEQLQRSPEMRTRKGKKQIYRAPMRNEARIINHIAVLLGKLGRKDEAIRLYEWVLKTFEWGIVKPKYRYHSYGVLKENLAAYQCSVEGSRQMMRYELMCGKTGTLAYNYMTLACAMEDDSSNRERCRQMIRDAYYLCELSKNYVNQKVTAEYYRNNYGEDIEYI